MSRQQARFDQIYRSLQDPVADPGTSGAEGGRIGPSTCSSISDLRGLGARLSQHRIEGIKSAG
jgi:hypothetical protein